MHELTKRLNGTMGCRIQNEIIVSYMKEHSEWLKRKILVDDETIDTAFGLSKPTLEEKFLECQKKHDKRYPSKELFWKTMSEEFANVSREHFKENPEELE